MEHKNIKSDRRTWDFLVLCGLLLLVMPLSGCSLLQVPVTVIQGTFSLVGQILKIVNKLPKPPPGVFF